MLNGTIPILLGFMSFSGNVPYNKMPHVKSQARLNFNYSVLVLYTLANGGGDFGLTGAGWLAFLPFCIEGVSRIIQWPLTKRGFSYSMSISMHVFLKINPFYMVLKNCCTIATFVLLGYIFPISCISLTWCVTGSRVSGKHSLDPDGITGPLGCDWCRKGKYDLHDWASGLTHFSWSPSLSFHFGIVMDFTFTDDSCVEQRAARA